MLRADGTVWSTGYNQYGELGTGDTEERKIFTQVKRSKWRRNPRKHSTNNNRILYRICLNNKWRSIWMGK
ncbi:MAG: hypothetical protein ACLTXR_05260 [Clostridia bacterium]